MPEYSVSVELTVHSFLLCITTTTAPPQSIQPFTHPHTHNPLLSYPSAAKASTALHFTGVGGPGRGQWSRTRWTRFLALPLGTAQHSTAVRTKSLSHPASLPRRSRASKKLPLTGSSPPLEFRSSAMPLRCRNLLVKSSQDVVWPGSMSDSFTKISPFKKKKQERGEK